MEGLDVEVETHMLVVSIAAQGYEQAVLGDVDVLADSDLEELRGLEPRLCELFVVVLDLDRIEAVIELSLFLLFLGLALNGLASVKVFALDAVGDLVEELVEHVLGLLDAPGLGEHVVEDANEERSEEVDDKDQGALEGNVLRADDPEDDELVHEGLEEADDVEDHHLGVVVQLRVLLQDHVVLGVARVVWREHEVSQEK